MPKIKTNKSCAKRFKIRPSGAIKTFQAFKRHILTKKTSKVKRNLRGSTSISAADRVAVFKMMPNG